MLGAFLLQVYTSSKDFLLAFFRFLCQLYPSDIKGTSVRLQRTFVNVEPLSDERTAIGYNCVLPGSIVDILANLVDGWACGGREENLVRTCLFATLWSSRLAFHMR